MKIYPAIDLKQGQCVRLTQGSYEHVTVYHTAPLAVAKSFEEQGASMLHVVDLDGAKEGKSINHEIIATIARETNLKIQTGGGIRTKQQVQAMLDKNISRVVLGSTAIKNPNEVKQWIEEFGAERIVLALDVRINNDNDPMLAVHGWQVASEKSLWRLLEEYQDAELKHVLCTDIQRDGLMQGPNLDLYQQCVKRFPSINFQASGGVSCMNDLDELKKIPVAGVIIGKALYENKIFIKDIV